MNHNHRKVLHSIFSHPVPSSVSLRDVESVVKEMGGETGHSGHGRLTLKLNGHSGSLHGQGHELSKDEVVQLRKFLQQCGVDPARDYPV